MLTISDHTSYNFTHGNDDPARKLSVYFNIKTIVRANQSEWVAVGMQKGES